MQVRHHLLKMIDNEAPIEERLQVIRTRMFPLAKTDEEVLQLQVWEELGG